MLRHDDGDSGVKSQKEVGTTMAGLSIQLIGGGSGELLGEKRGEGNILFRMG